MAQPVIRTAAHDDSKRRTFRHAKSHSGVFRREKSLVRADWSRPSISLQKGVYDSLLSL